MAKVMVAMTLKVVAMGWVLMQLVMTK